MVPGTGWRSAEGPGREAGWIQDRQCAQVGGWTRAEHVLSGGSQGDQGVVATQRSGELDPDGQAVGREPGR